LHECGGRSPVELLTRRGAKRTGAIIPGTRDQEARPPPINRHGASDQVHAPRRKEDDIEVGDEKSPQGQPEGAPRTEPSDRELRGTPRAYARGEGSFHLAVSHNMLWTTVLHITLAFIPAASEAPSVAAAQPQIETARGGAIAQVSKGSTDGRLARARSALS